MKKLSLLVFATLFALTINAQFTQKIKADSVLITNDSCSAELNLENSTKNIKGFLYNKGNGRTEFKRAMIKINDSIYLFGNDTLNIKQAINAAGGSGNTATLYNANDKLTNDRIVDLDTSTLSFYKSNKPVFSIAKNANVWIGKDSPYFSNFRLNVDSSLRVNHKGWGATKTNIFTVGSDSYNLFNVGSSGTTAIYTFNGNNPTFFANWGLRIEQGYETKFIGGQYNSYFNFQFGSQEKMRLIQNGALLLGTTTDDSTAILKLVSGTRGFLPPVWTQAQRLAIDGVSKGLIGYQSDNTENLYVYRGSGWNRILTDADYSLKRVILPADVVSNTSANTLTDVTNLSFNADANTTYKFKFYIVYSAAAANTGSRWTINSSQTASTLHYTSTYSLSSTSVTTNQGLSAYNLPASANATSASTGSNVAIIEGVIRLSSAGTVIARFASEVNNSAITALSNISYVEFEKL